MFSPIRSKRDVITLLMKTIKVLMLPSFPPKKIAGEIILQVAKMNRLFFVRSDKMFSINFPFVAVEEEDCLRFRSIHHAGINSMIASQILAILESSESMDSREVLQFAEPILDLCEADGDFWCLFRELLMQEDGYIRYDHDPNRSNGHLHPLHHLDIFYTTASTFKLGLNSTISSGHFADLLDVNTNCHYVRTP